MQLWHAVTISLTVASAANSATLQIVADREIYSVGDAIVLDVIGDAEGGIDDAIFGSIRFDPGLAVFLSSSQTPLTSFGGALVWAVGDLDAGLDFADAFNQLSSPPFPPDGPLVASVVLQAIAPGELQLSWGPELDFFGVTSSSGVEVTIIPEPGPVGLILGGLLAIACFRHRAAER